MSLANLRLQAIYVHIGTLGARGLVKDLLAISNWVLLIRLPAARKLLGAIDTSDVSFAMPTALTHKSLR